MSKHMDKWAQIQRPDGYLTLARHMDTIVVSYTPQGTYGTKGHMDSMATGDRPRPWSARNRERGLLARLHWNCEKRAVGVLVWRHLGAAPMQTPQ